MLQPPQMVPIFFHVRVQTQKNQQRDRRKAASFPLFQRDRTIRVVIDLYHHILEDLKSSFIFLGSARFPQQVPKNCPPLAESVLLLRMIRGERIMQYRDHSLIIFPC